MQKKEHLDQMLFLSYKNCCAYCNALTNLVSFDLLLEALFLWITFFLAKRSNIEITLGNNSAASVLTVVFLNFLIAFLVVLA